MCRSRRFLSSLLFLILIVPCTYADEFTTGLTPGFRLILPTGEWSDENLAPIGMGGGIEGLFGISSIKYLTVGADLGYLAIPANADLEWPSSEALLSLISLGIGVRGDLPMGDRLNLYARAHASGYYAIVTGSTDLSAPGFCWGVGGGLTFLFSNRLQLQAGASFEHYPGLFGGVGINLGLTTRLSGPGTRAIPRESFVPNRPGALPGGGYIELLDASLDPFFPVLLKYYRNHPFGSAVLVNKSRKTLTDVTVSFIQTEYIGTPQPCAEFAELAPGEEVAVDITAVFQEDILSVTEGSILSAELLVEYRVDGVANTDGVALTLDSYHRNAIEWDDDLKIAAFITKRDEEVMKYARNVASIVRDEGLRGFSEEFQMAIALLGALDVTGVAYVVDPVSSYEDLAAARAIDSVQFPRQTLQYKGGDCDDMTAAYAALLEAVAVDTAFITVPGHIYPAFKLEMSPAQAERAFSRFDDLIVIDEDVWVPVETTALSKGFTNAWALGARQWREHKADGNAVLHPTADAWTVYEPVAFSVSNYELAEPRHEDTASVFAYELDQYVDQEISSRERTLLARLNRKPDDPRTLNSLGVLYARYDRKDDAKGYFEEAAANGYIPAILNLGNMAFVEKDYQTARERYESVLAEMPDYPAAILGLARTDHALENYEGARSGYEMLAERSPDLASRYTYLAEGSAGMDRASDALLLGGVVEWDEE